VSATSRSTALRALLKVEWLEKLGGTVVCIASGPSLTAEDCELVRSSGLATIVTNTTFRMCPWATALMGYDVAWWKQHHKEVAEKFAGHKVSGVVDCKPYGARSLKLLKFNAFGNSGCAAISLAVLAGSKKVVMLGFDCQHTGGKTHWHGDHPAPLGNAGSVNKWPQKFLQVAQYARRHGCQVINASRETALTMFPRVALEECL
jgi:hypothetical protein